MTEARACIVAMFATLALFVSFIVGTCCIHDLAIMRDKLDAMQAAQVEQAREIREAKTDAEQALHVVITGDWE